jgi:hypothetical protein
MIFGPDHAQDLARYCSASTRQVGTQLRLQEFWNPGLPVLDAEQDVQQDLRERLGHRGLFSPWYVRPFQG